MHTQTKQNEKGLLLAQKNVHALNKHEGLAMWMKYDARKEVLKQCRSCPWLTVWLNSELNNYAEASEDIRHVLPLLVLITFHYYGRILLHPL